MPFDPEFLHHLHELMVEVSDNLRESEAKYKAEVLFKARKTNNSDAMPRAYADAELHALRTRVGQTIEKYIDALIVCGINVDSGVEKEMQQHIVLLASGSSSLYLPPGLHIQDDSAIQRYYAMERPRVCNQVIREGMNRLRELKMKSRQLSQPTPATMVNNYNAPIGTVYNNSVHHSTVHLQITQSIIQDIKRASEVTLS